MMRIDIASSKILLLYALYVTKPVVNLQKKKTFYFVQIPANVKFAITSDRITWIRDVEFEQLVRHKTLSLERLIYFRKDCNLK